MKKSCSVTIDISLKNYIVTVDGKEFRVMAHSKKDAVDRLMYYFPDEFNTLEVSEYTLNNC